jgi:hypothetical protein
MPRKQRVIECYCVILLICSVIVINLLELSLDFFDRVRFYSQK